MSGAVDIDKSMRVTQAEYANVSRVLVAASVGTIFEWYDFYLYGSLAPVISKNFFAGVDPITGFLLSLLTFAAGFMMRPLGALIFGRIGDMIGRKKCFLATVVLMACATLAVGCLPTYASIGLLAPILLVVARMLQGTALGGEYSGAATYVAEHSPAHRRGVNTSWISAGGTLGLLMSYGVILAARYATGDRFDAYGWRIPFIFSIVLLIISVRIRMKMNESPAFEKLREEDKVSRAPFSEAFLKAANLKRVLVAFGMCAGMTSLFYISGLYPIFFLTQALQVDPKTVNTVVLLAMAVCVPAYPFFGWLSDRIGRKPVLLMGYALSVALLFPAYHLLPKYSNPAFAMAQTSAPITVEADPASCSFMFNPLGNRHFKSSCDIAKQALANLGVSYSVVAAPGNGATIKVGTSGTLIYNADNAVPASEAAAQEKQFRTRLAATIHAAGYPDHADPARIDWPKIFAILVVMIVLSVIAASAVPLAMVELFPTRVRYTSMALPYNIATGWVGGLLPTMVFALSAQSGNLYTGLWYPIGWGIFSFVLVLLFFRETNRIDIKA